MNIDLGPWYWTGYVGTWSFIAKYCAFNFIAIIGLMQIVAAKWELQGIAFFKNKKRGYAFGTVAIVGAFVWFFMSHDYRDLTFDAPVQIFWICITMFFAFLSNFTIAHVINRNLHLTENEDSPEDIEILKQTTYWRAIFRYRKRKSR